MPNAYHALVLVGTFASPVQALTTIDQPLNLAVDLESAGIEAHSNGIDYAPSASGRDAAGIAGAYHPSPAVSFGRVPPGMTSLVSPTAHERLGAEAISSRAPAIFGLDTWAAMILCVGAVGAILRRLRSGHRFGHAARTSSSGVNRSGGRNRRSSGRRRR